MNSSLSRWAATLLVLSPVLLIVVAGLDAPSVSTSDLNDARQDLLQIHDNEAGLLVLVAFEIIAGAAIVGAAAFLAGRLPGAPALAAASLAAASIAGALVWVTAAIETALIVRVAEAVSDGEASSSTLLLGQALYEVFDSMLFIGVLPATGLWVTLASAAMVRTGMFSRRAAYLGIGAAPLTVLASLTFAVGAAFVFAGLGMLLVIIWSVWLAVSIVREGLPPPTAEAPA